MGSAQESIMKMKNKVRNLFHGIINGIISAAIAILFFMCIQATFAVLFIRDHAVLFGFGDYEVLFGSVILILTYGTGFTIIFSLGVGVLLGGLSRFLSQVLETTSVAFIFAIATGGLLLIWALHPAFTGDGGFFLVWASPHPAKEYVVINTFVSIFSALGGGVLAGYRFRYGLLKLHYQV